MRCDCCDKSGQFGHNVSHSKRRTNHRWVANIQTAKVECEGREIRLNLCTRCLRTARKAAATAA